MIEINTVWFFFIIVFAFCGVFAVFRAIFFRPDLPFRKIDISSANNPKHRLIFALTNDSHRNPGYTDTL